MISDLYCLSAKLKGPNQSCVHINQTLPIGEERGDPALQYSFSSLYQNTGLNSTLRHSSLAPNNSLHNSLQDISTHWLTLWNQDNLFENESMTELSESLGTLKANFK